MAPSISFLGYTLSTYTLVTFVYLLIAISLTIHLNTKQGLTREDTLGVFAVAVPVAAIGARLLDVAEYSSRYRSWADLVGPHGSSIYGGLTAGIAAASVYSSYRDIRPLKLLDAGAPTIALGEAFTRLGCFLNGCCYGVPWTGPWAVTFPLGSFALQDQIAAGLIPASAQRSLPVHPVQIYSAIIMVVVAIYLIRVFFRPHREGSVFCKVLIAYGVLRLGVSPFRTEVLTSMKYFSVTFIMLGTIGCVVTRYASVVIPLQRNDNQRNGHH